ncbi:hypothetical protein [Blastococcus brunescens]|uniref:DUF4129 domain-containing protein n=1 Tax=Blastococcus brunescens TaxID=1564165 RepID=A0ABZ1B8W5_9ACTN|nr:hypothetical protein [Blastococcus sp. BMG 8361]WRL66561.1 hypothetical protein U6N30_14865 [Blastococcus sp. BMG 8361]
MTSARATSREPSCGLDAFTWGRHTDWMRSLMTTPPPTGTAIALDVGDDDELSWLLSLDPTVLAVLGGVLVALLVITAVAGWLVLRRLRRSPLVARGRELASRGRELGVQGATAVAARRLPPGHRRSSAELQLEIARARDRLRHQVATAQAAGAHLGDVADLVPSLEAEGVGSSSACGAGAGSRSDRPDRSGAGGPRVPRHDRRRLRRGAPGGAGGVGRRPADHRRRRCRQRPARAHDGIPRTPRPAGGVSAAPDPVPVARAPGERPRTDMSA